MEALHESSHGPHTVGFVFPDNGHAAFIVGDFLPDQGLPGFEPKLPAQPGRHGNLSPLGQGCQGIGHREKLSCKFIMSIRHYAFAVPRSRLNPEN